MISDVGTAARDKHDMLYRQTHSKKDDHLYQNVVIVDIPSDKQTGWPGPVNQTAIYGHHVLPSLFC